MFTSVVVPLDLQPEGDRALPIAAALAAQAGIPLELVSVSSPHMQEDVDLFELGTRARSSGATYTTALLHDNDVVRALAGFAADRPGALIVMATRARGPLGQRLLGSVSEGLLGRLDQPMLLVGPQVDLTYPQGSPTLVVGVDGSDASRDVTPALTSWVSTFDGPSPWLVEVVPPAAPPAPRDDVDELTDVRRLAGILAKEGVPTEWEVSHGTHPVRALIDFADRVTDAVVVVTSTRWTDPEHAHRTSVARELAQDAHHPVLVVPSARARAG